MEYKLQENILVNDSCCLHYVGSASRNLFYFTCSCLTSKTPFIVPLNSAVIDTVIGTKVSTFFQVDPVIRTKDGQLLEVYIDQKKLIPLDEVPSGMSSTACQKNIERKLKNRLENFPLARKYNHLENGALRHTLYLPLH